MGLEVAGTNRKASVEQELMLGEMALVL